MVVASASPPDDRKRWLWRWGVIVTAAFVPIAPIVAIAAALLVWLATPGASRRGGRAAARERWIVLALAAAGVVTHLTSTLAWPAPSPLDRAPLPLDAAARPNLLAANDASWLRGWSRADGHGPYATPGPDGFYRIERRPHGVDAPISEIVSNQEIPFPAGTPATVSAVVRHDGTDFGAVFMMRTRERLERLETRATPLDLTTTRLEAIVPAVESPVRLRSLQLVDLAGDWTYVDIGWPTLSLGADSLGYASHAYVPAWYEGLAWWSALALTLLAAAAAGREAVARVGPEPLALGLTAGLLVQTSWTLLDVSIRGLGVRAGGTFGEPNLLAHVAVVSALAVVALAPQRKVVGTVALGLALALVLLSGSRAGMVGYGVGTVAMLIASVPRERAWRTAGIAAVVVVGAGLALLVLGAPVERLLQPLAGDDNLRARTQAWAVALDAAAARPLLGLGHERFALTYEFAQPHEPGPRHRNAHPHNVLLYFAAASGWLVAGAAAVAVLALLAGAVRRRDWPAVVVLVTAAALNTVDSTAINAAVALPVWVACRVTTSDPGGGHG